MTPDQHGAEPAGRGDAFLDLIVLGSAQDGGVPQLGMDPISGVDRMAASVAVVGEGGQSLLIDASPDVRKQQRLLLGNGEYANRRSDNAFDGVLLTHAHMGHYAGLVHFGVEAHNSSRIPCWGTLRMRDFLLENEPWARLLRNENLEFRTFTPGDAFSPWHGLTVRPIEVPHRAGDTDAVGFSLLNEATGGTAFYLPDIGAWELWPEAFEVVGSHDVSLLDGCFFDDGEALDRPLSEVPHPLVVDTLARFSNLAQDR